MTIRNIIFSYDGHKKLEFEKVELNQIAKRFLDMTYNQKGDGFYKLRIEREGGKTEYTSGEYYTNGGSLDSKVTCEIKNETILMKFSGIAY